MGRRLRKDLSARRISAHLDHRYSHLTFAPAIIHITSLSIMATVAPATAGRSSQQIDIGRSDNLPEKGTERFSGDNDEVRFFQDGSKTGARVLGE